MLMAVDLGLECVRSLLLNSRRRPVRDRELSRPPVHPGEVVVRPLVVSNGRDRDERDEPDSRAAFTSVSNADANHSPWNVASKATGVRQRPRTRNCRPAAIIVPSVRSTNTRCGSRSTILLPVQQPASTLGPSASPGRRLLAGRIPVCW